LAFSSASELVRRQAEEQARREAEDKTKKEAEENELTGRPKSKSRRKQRRMPNKKNWPRSSQKLPEQPEAAKALPLSACLFAFV
jgi:hypothetical protein